jgi:hypothetical protein
MYRNISKKKECISKKQQRQALIGKSKQENNLNSAEQGSKT